MMNADSDKDKRTEILNIIRNTKKKSFINGGIISPYKNKEKVCGKTNTKHIIMDKEKHKKLIEEVDKLINSKNIVNFIKGGIVSGRVITKKPKV